MNWRFCLQVVAMMLSLGQNHIGESDEHGNEHGTLGQFFCPPEKQPKDSGNHWFGALLFTWHSMPRFYCGETYDSPGCVAFQKEWERIAKLYCDPNA